MLSASRAITQKLLRPAACTLKCSVRHKTVHIFTISPPIQPTLRTMGPYPKTPEELEKAARKYNMILEDYRPYPEEDGWGDYPDLPEIGGFNRDKYDDFEDVWECRHYGEPFHLNADIYSWERKDPMWDEKVTYYHTPYWYKISIIGSAVIGIILWYEVLGRNNINFNMPWKMRQYHEGPYYAFPEVKTAHDSHHHH